MLTTLCYLLIFKLKMSTLVLVSEIQWRVKCRLNCKAKLKSPNFVVGHMKHTGIGHTQCVNVWFAWSKLRRIIIYINQLTSIEGLTWAMLRRVAAVERALVIGQWRRRWRVVYVKTWHVIAILTPLMLLLLLLMMMILVKQVLVTTDEGRMQFTLLTHVIQYVVQYWIHLWPALVTCVR